MVQSISAVLILIGILLSLANRGSKSAMYFLLIGIVGILVGAAWSI
jgi:xanthosine utilization system XapX-like protein